MRYTCSLILLILFALGTIGHAAQVPWGATFTPGGGFFVQTKHGYLPDFSIEGVGTEAGAFKDPSDLFVSADGYLWVVDTGNNRFVQFTPEGEFVRAYGDLEGPGAMNAPAGIFVDDETIYVADTENARVVKFRRDGSFMEALPAPQSSSLGKDFSYKPSKLVVDGRGYLYVVSRGTYQGLIQLDPAGTFRGFFASNRLFFDWQRYLARIIATAEQREQLARQLPPEHTNVAIDPQGNIYTTTVNVDWNQIKRYNSVEKNLLEPTGKSKRKDFRGNSQYMANIRPPERAAFNDVAVDQRGIMTVIDSQTGQITQYDEEGIALMLFGRAGEGQAGLFRYAASVVVDPKGRLFVLDGTKNIIYVFRPTEFLGKIHTATSLFYGGKYEQAAEVWREVLTHHAGFEVAHRGIAKAMLRADNYELAMHHYLLGNSPTGYSKAFEEARFQFLRRHFNTITGFVVGGLLLISFGPMLWRRFRPQAVSELALASNVGYLAAPPIRGILGPFKEGFRLIRSPADVFWELKWLERGTYPHAFLLIGSWLFLHVAGLLLTSFHYGSSPDFRMGRLIAELIRLVLPFLTWIGAQYLVATISDGEGRFRDVFIGSAYALIPYIFLVLPLAAISNVLTWAERPFYFAVYYVGVGGTLFLMFLQVKFTHNLNFRQTLFITCAGLFAVLVIWGSGILLWGLIAQMVTFVIEAFTEVLIR